MNVKAISTNVGKALLVSALFMFLSMIVSIVNGRDEAFGPLLISFIITLLVGAFPFIFVRGRQPLTLKDGFLTIVLSWLLSFIFGMLPYVLYGGEFTFINAWFESVSGFTTTGSTILNDIEALPKGLLFWRSSTHFIGGLGVVVFLLLVIPDASPYRLKLTNMEMSSLSKEGYRYKSSKVVWIITTVYVSLTTAILLSLWAAGMPFFDALNHAFSIAATGGFSTRNLSIGAYESDTINFIVLFFMALCAMHFGLIYAVFATRSFKPFKNSVTAYYFGSIAVMSLLIMFSLLTEGGYDSFGRAVMDSTFTVVSYMSTAGFAICDNAEWPWLAGVVLLFASFQCGCAGSTTGGIKVDRILIAFKAISNEIKHRLHPSSVSHTRLSGHHLADGAVSAVLMYIVVYFVVIFISIIAVMLCGCEATEAVSGVIASVGSVGPGLGELGCLDNYSAQPAMAKFIYAFDMFLGRVEIYPVLVVISMIFRRNR
ncbi:MAG: TrkH family potassium uptake protein [Bacteroidales bacterium]|nr:TrkH family potassium uptake protein [Bacteroidales bacterium]MBR1959038.1 TrkH family potassium uptake protein [Bacteroidales bacterium]